MRIFSRRHWFLGSLKRELVIQLLKWLISNYNYYYSTNSNSVCHFISCFTLVHKWCSKLFIICLQWTLFENYFIFFLFIVFPNDVIATLPSYKMFGSQYSDSGHVTFIIIIVKYFREVSLFLCCIFSLILENFSFFILLKIGLFFS